MYRKLKFFKMFLGTILMTLTLISVLKSCSYAYNLEDFLDLTQQVYNDTSTTEHYDDEFKYHTNVVLYHKDQLRTLLSNYDIKSIYGRFTRRDSGHGVTEIYVYTGNNLVFSSQTNTGISCENVTYYKFSSNGPNSSSPFQFVETISITGYGKTNSWGLLDFSNGPIDLTNCYYQNFYVPSGPRYVSVDNGTISVTNEVGTSFIVNRLPFNRTVTSWKIGRINNITDEVVFIKGHFGPLISSDNGGNIFNTKYQFIWRKGARVESNGFTIAEDGNVYINTQYLIPNQTYECWFLYSKDNIITYEFGQTMYFAYYSNTIPSNPSAISSDLNDDSDIGFINAFGDIVSPDKEDINNTVDNIFTNPYGSGEFFGITYDDDFDDWGFGTFIYNLIQGIITTFTSFNNVTMDFGVLGAINSSAFSIGNSYVGAFLSFFCNAILVITLIFWYYRLVKSFATLDLTTISKYDFDKMFNIF